MSREVTEAHAEAHYLHDRSGLEPVLQPPVPRPTAMAWLPGRQILLVATRGGELFEVDPAMGTRRVAGGLDEVATLAVHPDRTRFVVLDRAGSWRIGRIDSGEILAEGRHNFLGGMEAFFLGNYTILLGDREEGRYLLILSDGRLKTRARLHPRMTAMRSSDGKLLLARATPAGLVVQPFGRNARFPKTRPTGHRLRVCGPHVLGFTSTGVAVWGQEGGSPSTMRLPDLTAGDVGYKGRWLALGTRQGAVALTRLDSLNRRVHPDLIRAFDSPVTSMAFASRGRWLATTAESLRLWSWEEG